MQVAAPAQTRHPVPQLEHALLAKLNPVTHFEQVRVAVFDGEVPVSATVHELQPDIPTAAVPDA